MNIAPTNEDWEVLLAEDFFEFGNSGRIYPREDTLTVPRQPIEAVLPLPDFDARHSWVLKFYQGNPYESNA